MYFHVFKIRCLTNLHVGSGDINYNIVDKEVEKDPVTGLPMIHASGIKGALLQHFKDMEPGLKNYIFGAPGEGDISKPGAYRFLDAHLLARPMRTASGDASCINVTTVEMLQNFLNNIESFGGKSLGKNIPMLNFGSAKFLATSAVGIEGLATADMNNAQKQESAWVKKLIGENYAFVQNMRDYDLPIIARNHLENGISTNLWYEEFVPHGSVFYMVILTPEQECELNFEQPVQIGGNASVGYGFTKIEKIDLSTL
jgi:CRISPR-associated protein Cmr4